MPVIMGFLCLIIAVYGYCSTKYLFNPISAMFFMWALILPFSHWGFYDTVVPSDRVYIVIAIGLVAFFIGTLIGTKPVKNKFGSLNNLKGHKYKFNYTLLYILGAITLVYYASQIIIVLRLLVSGYDYEYIRALSIATDTNVLRASAAVNMTKAFIATPMSYLALALLPIELLKEKKNKIMIIGCITFMFGYVFTTGGRSVILWFALYFIATYMMRKKKTDWETLKKIIKKYRVIIIIGGIGLVYFLLKMTFARKGEDINLLKQIYIYFICPLQNFDYHMNVVDNVKMYGNGLSSFYGLIYPIMYFLKCLGFNVFTPYVQTIYNMSFQDLQMGIDIGGGIYMNAFVTAFYQPYLDGRYIGVIIIMFIFGFVAGRIFYNAYYKNNMKSVLIYMLLLQKIVFSYVRFYFTQQAQSICFLLAFIVIIKCKEKDEEHKVIKF